MMKNFVSLLLCAAMTTPVWGSGPRQTYSLDPQRVIENHEKIFSNQNGIPDFWLDKEFAYLVVNPFSGEQRLPDMLPTDSDKYGTIRIFAAQGEFEAASFVMYPGKNVNSFKLEASKLTCGESVIPADAVDLKVVKCYYKHGNAWFAIYADALRKKLVPELLLNDESLVYVDTEKQENYIKCVSPDGSVSYEWASAPTSVNNFQPTDVNYELIRDADILQPVVLNQDEMKQFFVTVKVPEKINAGIYTGTIRAEADNKTIGSIPVVLRVYPFELPQPKTNYNLDKPFVCGFYRVFGHGGMIPNRIRNMAEHNVKNMLGFPSLNPFDPETAELHKQVAIQTGMDTNQLFSSATGCHYRVHGEKTPADDAKLKAHTRYYRSVAELSQKLYGHKNVYLYGQDEGSADAIREQQPEWDIVHQTGMNVMVTTKPHYELLNSLDFINLACWPQAAVYKKVVDDCHAMNPDLIMTWYSGPHTGPENPDYTRRLYGMIQYLNNFDGNMNYALMNDWRNWNEWGHVIEAEYRNLSIVYPTKDNIVNTLAWEGVREAMDDVRYATLLRQLSRKAVQENNIQAKKIAHRAEAALAYFDAIRRDPEAFRMECANYILQLLQALNQEKK